MVKRAAQGFTLVELILAMAFFAFILVMVTTGFVQINRQYTRGITQKNIQASARNVVDDIADNIRNADSSSIVIVNNGVSSPLRLCIGGVTYAYNHFAGTTVDTQTDELFNGASGEELNLERSTVAGVPCDATSGGMIPDDSRLTQSMLGSNELLQYLTVTRLGATNSYSIRIAVSTGVVTDFTEYGDSAQCRIETGDEYCHVTRLETVVTARN